MLKIWSAATKSLPRGCFLRDDYMKFNMRIFLYTIILFCIAPAVSAQRYLDFDLAAAKARTLDKMLIVECYADWNVGSRWMHKVLNNKDVAAYIDANFILTGIDADSVASTDFIQRHEIIDYPVFIVLGGGTRELTRIVGTYEAADFLTELKKIVKSRSTNHSVEASNAQWTLRQIGSALGYGNFDGARQLSEQYLAMLPPDDIIQPANWFMFENAELACYGSPAFFYILKNRELFDKNIGVGSVDKTLRTICTEHILPYAVGAYDYDSTAVAEFLKTLPAVAISSTREMVLLADMSVSRHARDYDLYVRQLKDALDLLPEEMAFTLTVSLKFIANHGPKSAKRAAMRLIERVIGYVGAPTKIAILTDLRNSMQ